MNYDHHISEIDSDFSWDWASVPECQWMPQCDLLLIPGGCDSCDFMRDDILWDEDGEPIVIGDEPPNPAYQSELPGETPNNEQEFPAQRAEAPSFPFSILP